MQPDSIIPDPNNPLSYDRYAYVRNSPTNFNDPTGNWEAETNDPAAELRRNAYLDAYEKADDFNGHEKQYYLTAASYYQAVATESSAENVEAIRAQLSNNSNKLQINGWNGQNNSLDTAFRSSGTEVSSGFIIGGIGLYGTLKATIGVSNQALQDNPLSGVTYTDKVLLQATWPDYHGFPESVDAFGADGKVYTQIGEDGVIYTHVEIPGEYKNTKGVFHYIINPEGVCNHRLFEPEE